MKKWAFFLWAGALAFTSCGRLFDDYNPTVTPQEYSLDGMKVISPAIRYGDDEASWNRNSYMIAPSSRLLMRFESLSQHARDVLVDDKSSVTVQIVLVDNTRADDAVKNLRLCPLTHPWMMLATWTKARTYGEDKYWSSPGAESDYDTSACAAPDILIDGKLSFDIKQWFLDYPRGRGVNYGHILVYDKSDGIEVAGDRSGSFSPRIFFKKYVSYSSFAR